MSPENLQCPMQYTPMLPAEMRPACGNVPPRTHDPTLLPWGFLFVPLACSDRSVVSPSWPRPAGSPSRLSEPEMLVQHSG